MDDAERIPIELGYEVAGQQPPNGRTTVREDGTLVIDILVPQPCATDPAGGEEIVVCAEVPDGGQNAPAAPAPSANLNEKIGKALHAQVGPLEVGSIRNRDGTYSFGARIRF